MKNSLPVVILIAVLIAVMILFSKIQNNDINQKIVKLNQEIEESLDESSISQTNDLNNSNQISTEFKSIPNWVFDLGFKEPKNLSLVKDKSKQTSKEDENGGYDSVELTYSGGSEEIKKSIEEIKGKLKINLKKIEQDSPDSNLIGYSNFKDSNEQPNFLITLYANPDEETLLVNFTNAQQMKTAVQPSLEPEPTITEEESIEEINLHLNDN